MATTKILILGATGMIGNTLFRKLSQNRKFDVFGTVPDDTQEKLIIPRYKAKIFNQVKIENFDSVIRVVEETKPDIVINCVGLIKQMPNANDAPVAIYMNALFPHRLAHLLHLANIRMIHLSTDCVFSGIKGNYLENDLSDATDIYGKTKYLGEVTNFKNCLTLRTSCFGHELQNYKGIVEWFLTQGKSTWGYRKAIYSGIPTVELAEILVKIVIPNRKLYGLYHVSADPISKNDLLNIIAKEYRKKIEIKVDDKEVVDRSLNSNRFRKKTGYNPPHWPVLVKKMHQDYLSSHIYRRYPS